jgi:hypothetical protein
MCDGYTALQIMFGTLEKNKDINRKKKHKN